MIVGLHPALAIRELYIGCEQAPLMVIDHVAAGPDELTRIAGRLDFRPVTKSFPGIRAAALPDYQRLLVDGLQEPLRAFFKLGARRLRLSLCHYSLVTVAPDALAPLQRVPHVDSLGHEGLATIHYLFHGELGGTAFYRHRSTGYEFIDASREKRFVSALKEEFAGRDHPECGYINGDTPLFERIDAQPAAFNRMLVYKRNSLHSGTIPPNFVADPNPATGRLSINSFIDPV